MTLGHPQGLGKPRAGMGASGSFRSSSGRASDVTPQLLPVILLFPEEPLKPPQGLHVLTSVPAPILLDREGSDHSVSQQCPAICPPGPPGPPGMPGFKVSSH